MRQEDIRPDEWNSFVANNNGSFLQSFEWGKFQESVGRQVFYLRGDPSSSRALRDYGEASAYQALVIKHNLPLGKGYLYCPRGPVIKPETRNQKSETNHKFQISNFQNEITGLSKQEKAIFLRIEPMAGIEEKELKELGFLRTKDVQPSRTLILDLRRPEEELLAQMHEKTRYNIGLAVRRGVTVRVSDGDGDFGAFWSLLNQTAKRQKIRLFGKDYYRKQLTVNGQQKKNLPQPLFVKEGAFSLWKREGGRDFENLLFIASYQGKVIAANLVNAFGDTATYLHGGSDNEFRSLMAPHLLQWEQIKYAKEQGCKFYDFWGYDEVKWPGISRFKKGFGGKEVSYIGTYDYVFDKFWYRIYRIVRNILR